MSLRRWLPLAVLVAAVSVSVAAQRGWSVDPNHSGVVFRVKHLGINHVYGRFNTYEGELKYNPDDVAASSLTMTVDAASVDTGIQARDEHLRNADFFNVAEHPSISFASTKVEPVDDDTLKVTGDLTLMGQTRPVTVEVDQAGPVDDTRGGLRAGFEATFEIRRSEFGLSRGIPMVGDEVRLTVALQAVAG